MITTPKIRYNLRDRGRKFNGQDRNYNVAKLVANINSPATQETVSTGGMLGYLGHMPRVRYGLEVGEAAVEGKNYVPIEPAFVTEYLHADSNGDVTHVARFLDTNSGNLAQKLWEEKVGGFSSAIDSARWALKGFDYVHNPNFLQNSFRGVTLDSIEDGGDMPLTLDEAVEAERMEMDGAIREVLAQLTAQRDALAAALDATKVENLELIGMLAKKGIEKPVLDQAFKRPAFGNKPNFKTMRLDPPMRDVREEHYDSICRLMGVR